MDIKEFKDFADVLKSMQTKNKEIICPKFEYLPVFWENNSEATEKCERNSIRDEVAKKKMQCSNTQDILNTEYLLCNKTSTVNEYEIYAMDGNKKIIAYLNNINISLTK